MIKLCKDKDEYFIWNGWFRTHCAVDGLTKADLRSLHKKIGKELNIPDWKKVMEKDRDRFLEIQQHKRLAVGNKKLDKKYI